MSQDTLGEDTPKTEVDKTTENNEGQKVDSDESDGQHMISKQDHKKIKGRIKDGYKQEIADLQSQLADLKQEKENARLKELEEKEEYKKLYEEQKVQLEETRRQTEAMAKKSAFDKSSSKYSWQDPSIVYGLVDFEKVTVNEDGSVEGLESQITDIVENRPFLLKKNPQGVNTQATATVSEQESTQAETTSPYTDTEFAEVQRRMKTDPQWYMDNSKEISARLRATRRSKL